MRISGGIHRSRVLASPRGSSTRPTSDRVREALFSILESRGALAGARVIDFFAGTGALGLEALSRGAEFATFVDSDRRALEALGRNIDALRERKRARVLPQQALRAVTTLEGDGATLVFFDPPYADVTSGDGVAKLLDEVVKHHVVRDGATLVLEHASRDEFRPITPALRETDARTYGDTTLKFYLYTAATP
jgi:16S rRNA (guanine966-N2)-methyltransferase